MKLILILLIAFILFWVPSLFYILFGWFKFWYHDILKWHKPDEDTITTDGFARWAICKYCGERIQQDSQGNWF